MTVAEQQAYSLVEVTELLEAAGSVRSGVVVFVNDRTLEQNVALFLASYCREERGDFEANAFPYEDGGVALIVFVLREEEGGRIA